MNISSAFHEWRDSLRSSISGGVLIAIIVMVVIGVVACVVPVKLPYSITTFGRIQPLQKWILTSGTNGQILASVINYKTGTSTGCKVTQFAREGTMKFSFRPQIAAGSNIQAGDTVATIYSSQTEERLADLNGQLAELRASMAADVTGEKEPVIKAYESKLTYAQEKAANQKRILERLRALYDRQLITSEEYEIAESEYHLLSAEVEAAKAQLESARSGVKQETVDLLKTRIAALTDELNILHQRTESFSIIAPISGRIARTYSADSLLVVSDISAYVALIPITVNEAPYVRPDQRVEVSTGERDRPIDGRLLLLDTETHQLKGRQIQTGTAVIDKGLGELPQGMISPCVIRCEPVTVAEYVKRLIQGL